MGVLRFDIMCFNATVASVQDRQTSRSHSKGISAGYSSGSLSSVGVNQSSAHANSKQTIQTDILANTVNINTAKHTDIKGAIIASVNKDGNDNHQLNLKTDTLTVSSLNNTNNSKSNAIGITVGGSVKNNTASNVSLNFANDKTNSKTKTLATLGSGNIQIADKENSDTKMLNTDIQNNTVDIYNISSHKGLKGELDTRLLTEDGREEVQQEYKDMDKNMKTIADTLPSATSDNEVEAIVGKIWDNITAYATLGVFPSNGNNGGVLGEIPILTGNKDSAQEALQIVSLNAPLYQQNTDKFMPIEQSDAYKQMSQDKQLQVQGLYTSKEPVTISKDNATYQNGGNGIMNDKGLATFNVLEQTGMIGQYQTDTTKPVEATVFYNPSRGLIADSAETLVDLFGGTTGIAKQYGEFNVDVTTARGASGSNFTQHSQNNALLYSGINYINSSDNRGAKFMPREYFYIGQIDASGNKIFNLPTYESFGSPVSGKTLENLISNKETGLGYTYKGAFTNPNDSVGESLGGNKGVNGEASLLDRVNLLNTFKLITPESPHSGYDPYKFEELKDVTGYKK
jgi:filamentous hemagglutinin